MARKPKSTPAEMESMPATVAEQDDGSDIAPRSLLKKKVFLDRAIARAGIRKTDARTAIEATLATLAEALAAGEEVVLPPLGRLKVMREKPNKKGRMLMVRLVLDAAPEADAEPLAEPEDKG